MNKNIRRFIFISLGILIFQTAFCQKNFIPGYIITLEGDTIRGVIDYHNREKNPDKIYFQDKIVGEKIIYTPNDIKLFSVQDELYVSAIVKTEVSPRSTQNLNFGSKLEIKVDTIFLQTVIQGVKGLYYYKNSDVKGNFFIRQNMEFELLGYKKYFKSIGGIKQETENRKYIGQLALYLHDCPSIQSELKNIKYSKISLEKLFLFYYDCTQSGIEFYKKTEKISTEIGVLAGVSLTSLEFHSELFDYLVKADYSPSLDFSTGLFFDIIIPGNNKRWSINNELIFTSYTIDGHYEDISTVYPKTYWEIGFSYLKLNNMVRYKYPIGKAFIYINAGISTGLAFEKTNYIKKEKKFVSDVTIEEGKAINSIKKMERGYTFGLGTGFKKYSFEMRYEKGNGMTNYMYLTSSTKRYYFLLGYRF